MSDPVNYEPAYEFARFVLKRNSDLTEGRGSDVAFGYSTDEDEALQRVKGASTQGSNGSIYVEEVDRAHPDPSRIVRERMVYGYHRDSVTGQWEHSWVDGRDNPIHDPEWPEYVRLCEHFGHRPKTRADIKPNADRTGWE